MRCDGIVRAASVRPSRPGGYIHRTVDYIHGGVEGGRDELLVGHRVEVAAEHLEHLERQLTRGGVAANHSVGVASQVALLGLLGAYVQRASRCDDYVAEREVPWIAPLGDAEQIATPCDHPKIGLVATAVPTPGGASCPDGAERASAGALVAEEILLARRSWQSLAEVRRQAKKKEVESPRSARRRKIVGLQCRLNISQTFTTPTPTPI